MIYFNWELDKDLEFVKRFLLLIIIIPTGAEGSMQVHAQNCRQARPCSWNVAHWNPVS